MSTIDTIDLDIERLRESVRSYHAQINIHPNASAAISKTISYQEGEIQRLLALKQQAIQESRKVESFEAVPPGDVQKVKSANSLLLLGAAVLGLVLLS